VTSVTWASRNPRAVKHGGLTESSVCVRTVNRAPARTRDGIGAREERGLGAAAADLSVPGPSRGIRLDARSQALVADRFVVRGDAAAGYVLVGERETTASDRPGSGDRLGGAS
jgi:hypothetical protein